MREIHRLLADGFDPKGLTEFHALQAQVMDHGEARLQVVFPQLARKIGRAQLGAGIHEEAGHVVDLSAWRRCDAAGLVLLENAAPSEGVHLDLYHRGDLQERTIALRAMACRPMSEDTLALLGEVQRTNTGFHVEAGALDSNLVVRALLDGSGDEGFTHEDLYRLVLKLAFLDLPAARVFEVYDHATPRLSEMLIAFRDERRAAGRPVWPDTYTFLGAAPVPASKGLIRAAQKSRDARTREAANAGAQRMGLR